MSRKLSWTQPQCERCWIEFNAEWDMDVLGTEVRRMLVSVRQPIRASLGIKQVERCSWCGEPTIVGIYVRHDPADVKFPAVEPNE